MRKIFAVARGQYENIGDIVLRRQLLDWVRPAGDLHVYVGNSPAGYDEGLRLHAGDVVYRSFKQWYRAAAAAAASGDGAYVFKPGEVQMTLPGMKEHVSALPLLMTLRIRGGRTVRAGVGTRNYAWPYRALMRPSIALSDVTLWRDGATGYYMRTGGVIPDLAFGEGAPDGVVATFGADSTRRSLVISLRGDRAYPSEDFLEGVRRYASSNGLTVWAVTQVRMDDARTRQLAADLDGNAFTWDADTPHDVQEERLRSLYRGATLALSDRLHVAITAFTEGAVPVAAVPHMSNKIDRHFAAVGIGGSSIDATLAPADVVVARLDSLAGRRPLIFGQLLDARDRLRRHRDEVRQLLGSPSSDLVVPVAG